MKSKISKILPFASAAAVLTPFLAFAQNNTGNINQTGGVFINLIRFIQTMMGYLFPLVSGALILLFGYELIMFFIRKRGGDAKGADDFKGNMIKAIIALFLWFTVFGIIQTVAGAFGLGVGDDVSAGQTPVVVFTP